MKLRAFMTVVAMLVLAASATSVAVASTRTDARIYRAFTATGRPTIRITRTVRGDCFAGSSAIVRRDAWRCVAGRYIDDPCFSSARAPGFVLCPPAAWNRFGVRINLITPLPTAFGHRRAPSTSGTPWGIRTVAGLRCETITGTSTLVGRIRANFSCPGRQLLWGAPMRRFSPWRIFISGFNAIRLTRTAKIRIAWF
jgi:hypothetical protein